MKFLSNKSVLIVISSLVIALFGVTCLKAQSILFNHSVIADGVSSQARQIGDIDGDGHGDIVVVEGEFSPEIFAWFEYPSWTRHDINDEALLSFDYVADSKLGDIDNDGDLDLIFPDSHNAGDKARILFWFENPRPKENPKSAIWKKHIVKDLRNVTIFKEIAIGDIDNDGKLDVVVRAEEGGYIFFQINPDDWSMIEVKFRPHEGLDVGDLDRDGDLDIVLNGSWWENPDDSRNGVWTEYTIDPKWYNQNTGSWMDNNSQVRVGDIDCDGCIDIVIASSEKDGYPVSWYRAPIDPKHGTWIEYVIGQLDFCHGLQLGDIDRDGDIDIMAAEMVKGTDPDKIVVYINEGHPKDPIAWKRKTPSFREQVVDNVGAYWAVLGDVGGDGDLDIVSSRSYDTPPIEMWENRSCDKKLSLDKWTYIQVDDQRQKWGDFDEPNWLRAFGLAAGDLTGDGYGDIVSGRYFYRNPGGNMTGRWERIDLGINVDAMLIVNVDDDEYGDVIAEALPNIYWFEAVDMIGSTWRAIKIATMPGPGHHNSQGYTLAQLLPGRKPEIVLESGEGIYYFEIPTDPESGSWLKTCITGLGSHAEGIGVGDIDGDGFIDVSAGMGWVGIVWWKNPGNGSGNWHKYEIGRIERDYVDKLGVADINGDGRPDVVVAEELYPDTKPAHIYCFTQPNDPLSEAGLFNWKRHTALGPKFTLNNLSIWDMDRDGDTDIITAEHKGTRHTFILENDGRGNFKEHVIGSGKEGHNGAFVADLDNDGDLDIIHIAWDEYQYLHLFRNDAIVLNPKEQNR